MSQPIQPLQTQSLVTTSLLAISIVFPILATGAVALRFRARRIKSQELKADDWTIVLSLVMSWAISIDTIVTGSIAGINTTTMNPTAAATLFLKCLWIEGIPLGIGLASIKISILLFYRRIFITKAFKWSVNAMVAVLVAWAISTVLVQIFAGNPVSSVWNPLAPKLRYKYAAFTLAVAGMSIVFDLMVLCFPLPAIRQLQMPTRRKVTVAGIFWLGAFCCVAAALRFYFLHSSTQAQAGGKNYNDAIKGYIWATIEPNCSIIAACLPTYGNLSAGKHNVFSSLHSFFSFKTRYSSSNNNVSSGNSNRESSMLGKSNKSKDSRKAWQMLDKNVDNNSVEVTAQGQRADSGVNNDLEAGVEMVRPVRIDVTRGFRSESRAV